MKKKIFLFLFTALFGNAFSLTLTLFNDSPFILNATILAADGTLLAEMTLNPQHQHTWQDSFQGGATFSQTPLTVIWECKEGTEYGVYTNLGPGSFVPAQSSTGARYCKPRKKKGERSTRDDPLN